MAREGLTTLRGMGIAVSMVRAYQRSMEKERADRKAADRKPSEHVGEIGVRREFTLTCHRIFETEGNYGVTGIHKMTDPDGNELTWFASGGTQWMEEGRTYRAKATVKKHDEYRGTKQTIVNRLKTIEEIKP